MQFIHEEMGKYSLDFTAFKHHSGTQLWRKPSPKTPGEENGCVLSIRWVIQPPQVKNPCYHLYPTDHRLQQRLVAGMCPTSVLGHGHQWLLRTRIPGGHPPPLLKGLHYFWAEIKTWSGFQFWRTSISSSITLLLLPNSYQATLCLKFYKGFILAISSFQTGSYSLLSFHWGYYLFSQDAYEG